MNKKREDAYMSKGKSVVLSIIGGTLIGAIIFGGINIRTVAKKEKKIDKFKSYYNVLNQWLCLNQSKRSIVKYFKDNGYSNIAIYGMGEMGNRLCDELKNSEITVKYGIDKAASSTYSEIDVYEMDDELEPVDVVVVSAIFIFDEVEEELSEKLGCPVVSLEDVVYSIK